jgi:hypothetical protein
VYVNLAKTRVGHSRSLTETRDVRQSMDDDYDYGPTAEEAHPFETDVKRVVLINHTLILRSLTRAESGEVARFKQADKSGSNQQPFIDCIGSRYNELRRAATNLALVGLITRFHHWLIYLANLSRAEQITGGCPAFS